MQVPDEYNQTKKLERTKTMVVYTMTKKQIFRIAGIIIAAAAVVLLIIFAVTGSVTASAESEKKPVYCVERTDNKVALTFDCAWGDSSDTLKILEILEQTGIRATFFVTGEYCDEHPDAVRKISEAGHSVQNMSDKNRHIAGMNVNDLIADTKEAAQKIKTASGKAPAYYRAPYGDYDEKSLTTLEGMGYTVVQWSVDSKDLDDPDAASVCKRVTDSTVSGSVLLFHCDSDVTAEALPQIITQLKQKGFELVKTEDLLFSSDYIIDEKGVQKYQPAISTALPIVYSDDNAALDSAFEKMRINLTLQQIYDLSSVGRVGLVDDIKEFLNEQELLAVREATYEELKECYLVLVYAAENYGAGGSYTDPEYEEIPQIVPPTEISGTENEEAKDPPAEQPEDDKDKESPVPESSGTTGKSIINEQARTDGGKDPTANESVYVK